MVATSAFDCALYTPAEFTPKNPERVKMLWGPEITEPTESVGDFHRSEPASQVFSPAQLWLNALEGPPEDSLPVPSFGNRGNTTQDTLPAPSFGHRGNTKTYVGARIGPGYFRPEVGPKGPSIAPVPGVPHPGLVQSPTFLQSPAQWSSMLERNSSDFERNSNNKYGRNGSDHQYAEDEFPPDHTTVMIRHIACRFTRNTLQEALDQVGLAGTYDFVYLPLNCARRANLGYCFVNFLSREGVEECKRLLTGRTLGSGLSQKRCEVSLARVQGREGSFHQNFLGSQSHATTQSRTSSDLATKHGVLSF